MSDTPQPEATVKVPYEKPLAELGRFESIAEFVQRCEREGIARQCVHCGAKRRYSKLVCPSCGQTAHKQVAAKSIYKDLDQSYDEMLHYHEQTHNPGLPEQSAFTPNEEATATTGETATGIGADFDDAMVAPPSSEEAPSSPQEIVPQHDPELEDDSVPEPPKQITDMTRTELMRKVKELGGKIENTDTKESLVSKYESLLNENIKQDDPELE